MREITGYSLDKATGLVIIYATDNSELNFQRIERYGENYIDSHTERYIFYTTNKYHFLDLRNFLKSQKSTATATTYKDALSAIVGTTISTYSIRKYRRWA